MHTIEIPEANINQNIPAELAECNEVQYINFCNLLYKKTIGEINHKTLPITEQSLQI